MVLGADETVAFLATVPFLHGVPGAELAELARVLRRREAAVGDVLWHEGEDATDMVMIAAGRVSVSLRLPGARAVEMTSLGRGEILGEVPLLDGGQHSATVRVIEPATLLFLRRADLAALVSRSHPTAFALKRNGARLLCARLRRQLEALAATLGPAESPVPALHLGAELEFCGPPDSRYVRRLSAFRAFDSLALWGFLTAGRYALCPAGRTLIVEGLPATSCYLTINGAVEKVIVRGRRRIRVGLAGPGQAFGYESLIDQGAAPMTASTRERTLLLMLAQESFARLFNGETPGAHVFLDVIIRELIAAQRQAMKPQARLAVSV
jgi:CRP-like cAMP-binding protein